MVVHGRDLLTWGLRVVVTINLVCALLWTANYEQMSGAETHGGWRHEAAALLRDAGFGWVFDEWHHPHLLRPGR
jgi:hypothetical protein